jgi:hypothetical protein
VCCANAVCVWQVFCQGSYVTLTIHESQPGSALLHEAREAILRKPLEPGIESRGG